MFASVKSTSSSVPACKTNCNVDKKEKPGWVILLRKTRWGDTFKKNTVGRLGDTFRDLTALGLSAGGKERVLFGERKPGTLSFVWAATVPPHPFIPSCHYHQFIGRKLTASFRHRWAHHERKEKEGEEKCRGADRNTLITILVLWAPLFKDVSKYLQIETSCEARRSSSIWTHLWHAFLPQGVLDGRPDIRGAGFCRYQQA